MNFIKFFLVASLMLATLLAGTEAGFLKKIGRELRKGLDTAVDVAAKAGQITSSVNTIRSG